MRQSKAIQLGTDLPSEIKVDKKVRNQISNAIVAYNDFLDLSIQELSTSLEPWNDLVEILRATWGDAMAFDRIAIISAYVRLKGEKGEAPSGILDAATPLVKRYRFARMKSGAPKWWEKQFQQVASNEDKQKLLLLCWVFATQKTILKLSHILSELIDGLNDASWKQFISEFNAISMSVRQVYNHVSLNDSELQQAKQLSPRAVCLLGRKVEWFSKCDLVNKVLPSYEGNDKYVYQFMANSITQSYRRKPDFELALSVIRKAHKQGVSMLQVAEMRDAELDFADAQDIATHPECYPRSLVAHSDKMLTSKAGSEVQSMGVVAEQEEWFS